MAEYTPLMASSPDDCAENEVQSRKPTPQSSPGYLLVFSLLMAFMAIFASAAFHLSVASATYEPELLLRPKDLKSSLRIAQPSPNLAKGHATMKNRKFKFPRMVFPMVISLSVQLSNSSWPKCYLTGWVSSSEDLAAGHKNYTSEGVVTAVEIWNVSAPANREALKSKIHELEHTSNTDFAFGHSQLYESRDPEPFRIFGCTGDQATDTSLRLSRGHGNHSRGGLHGLQVGV
ncbi:hypothetical protein C8R43DRAFT_953970 [Mycena crocata]|nr:hypothetical protein C8R43DRAFT_953970 [Mycena crocata]